MHEFEDMVEETPTFQNCKLWHKKFISFPSFCRHLRHICLHTCKWIKYRQLENTKYKTIWNLTNRKLVFTNKNNQKTAQQFHGTHLSKDINDRLFAIEKLLPNFLKTRVESDAKKKLFWLSDRPKIRFGRTSAELSDKH